MKHRSIITILFLAIFVTLSAQTNNMVYDLANGCYNLTFKKRGNDSEFVYSRVPSKYYFKAAGLGEYLLYGKNNKVFTRKKMTFGHKLSFVETQNADEGAIWILEYVSGINYRLKNKGSGRYLGQNRWGKFIGNASLDRSVSFKLNPAGQCEIFPEASISATQTGQLKGKNPDGSVWGMADIHSHLFANEAYGRYLNAGKPFSPFGIEDALRDCNKSHGLRGSFDLYATATGDQQGTAGHNTKGYPNFEYWPSHIDFNHQKGYYQWLNRARLGGLRLLTVLSVQNEVLNQIYNEMSRYLRAVPTFLTVYKAKDVKNSMQVHDQMIEKVHAMVDYVDAQEGGPGKGWLRIAHNPVQARQIISEGKLAIVMGMELEAPFNCITSRDGQSNCTREYLEAQLDAYKDKGISHIFMNHHWDNDFGGARQFEPFLELSNVLYNNNTFEWEAADGGSEGIFGTHEPIISDEIEGISSIGLEIIARIFNIDFEEPDLPDSQTGKYRNAKGLNNLGKVFIEECMQRGIMIDFGHSTKKAVEEAYTLLDQYDYPPLFTHSANFDEMTSVLKRNGILSPMLKANGFSGYSKPCEYTISSDFAELIKFGNQVYTQNKTDYVGIPFTSDLFGGVPHMNGPRFNNETNPCNSAQANPVNYPFTSHDGAVVFERQQTGNRIFDINTDGLAHVGLLPDMIQDLKQQGYNDQDLSILFNGAEEYLRLWERSLRASSRVADSNLRVNEVAQSSKNVLPKVTKMQKMKAVLYPTLVENTFNLQIDRPATLVVRVYDTQGKVYYQNTLDYKDANPKSIHSLESVPPGVFFVRVADQDTGEYAVYKVIKK